MNDRVGSASADWAVARFVASSYMLVCAIIIVLKLVK